MLIGETVALRKDGVLGLSDCFWFGNGRGAVEFSDFVMDDCAALLFGECAGPACDLLGEDAARFLVNDEDEVLPS